MKALNLNVATSMQWRQENEEFQNQIMKEEKEYIEKEKNIHELREAIFDGIESGIAENFNPKSHLEVLKREYKNVQH
ncbi:MAG: hypothetical protein IJA42_06630 [Bacteroidales bacterium]|nr:hypothetical protein [Bacteroidales bacterium]